MALEQVELIADKGYDENKKKHDFYIVKINNDGYFSGVIIDRVKLLRLLTDNGFYRYDINVERFIYIRVIEKRVKHISSNVITDWFFSYLEGLEPYSWELKRKDKTGEWVTYHIEVNKEDLQNKFLMAMGSYFSENILSRLIPTEPIRFNEDTKESNFIYYQNGFVYIDKKGIAFETNYSQLQYHVWENQVLDRDYNPSQEKNAAQADFYRFCWNVSGQKQDRFDSLQTIIGYLLHGYFHYKMRAVILTDAQIDLSGAANGRTGKGILATGLGKMLNNGNNEDAQVYCQINGKGFDFNDKHRYGKADINTKLIHLEDVKAYFPFDNLFSDITENLTVDKKNINAVSIRTKLVISTNKTILIQGGSAKDRAIQYEFAEYYSDKFCPQDEFKKWFFTDWTKEEYQLFDAFMCLSIAKFFKNGGQVIDPPTINLDRRALMDHTSQEFVTFMDYYQFTDEDYIKDTSKGFYLIPKGQDSQEFAKKNLYNEFIESYPDFSKRKGFTQARFTKWIRAYSEACELLQAIDPEQDERRSNGTDLVVLRRT